MRISTLLGAGIALLLLGNTVFSQQLKLGRNPYTIQKSAVLELNSENQGLLLVRISDTSLINSLTPPDGMIIFFTPTKQLMVRSNGYWQPLAVGAVIASLNGLTSSLQTFATGTAGTNINISSSGSAHTFNIPDASAAARGVITTGAQTIAGTKTFSSAPIFSSFTAGSVLFAGAGGLLSQKNTNLFWDATNNRMGVGTNTPSTALHVVGPNPLTLGGVQTGTNTTADSLLTITNGLVRKLPASTFATAGSVWSLGGNTVAAVKNLGTIDNYDLPFITNNTEKMRLTSSGYLGLGTNNPVSGFHKVSDNSENGDDYIFDDYGASVSAAIHLRKARGTVAAPLNLQSGDHIGALRFSPRESGSFSYTTGSGMEVFYRGSGTNGLTDMRFFTSGTERMLFSETGNIGIGSNTFDGTNPEKVVIDAGTTTSVNALYLKGSINKYFQMNIQNLSTGNQSSSDIVATANNGTETTNFIDLGINGSGYVYQLGNPIETGKANDGYLLSAGNDFYLVNNNPTKAMIFTVGGTAPANEAMRIVAGENVGIATTTPQAKLDVSGSFKLGASGSILNNMIKASVPVTDNSSITTTQSLTKTVTVTGAALNGVVMVSPRTALPNGVGIAWARVSAAGSVQINFIYTNGGLFASQSLGTVTFDIAIIQ